MIKRSLILVYQILKAALLSLLPVIATAMELRFEQLNTEYGLAGNTVQTITQDRDGFMWFGTYGGLSRYDGYRFINYQYELDNENSLSKNHILALHQARNGIIWIGTRYGGFNKLDPKSNTITRYTYDEENPAGLINDVVHDIDEDFQGNLWLATFDGISRFNPDTESFINYPYRENDPKGLSGKIISSIHVDLRNRVWAGTTGSGVNVIDPNNEKVDRFTHDKNNPNSISDNYIRDIFTDKNNNIWFLTGKNLDRWIPEKKIFERYFEDKQYTERSFVNASIDRTGIIWIASTSGLIRFNPRSKQSRVFTHRDYDISSLSESFLISTYIDNSNVLWIGTRSRGVNKLSLLSQQFTWHKHIADKKTIGDGSIYSLGKDSDNTIWVLNNDRSLTRLDEHHNVIAQYTGKDFASSKNPNPWIRYFVIGEADTIWLGTQGDGFKKYNYKTGEIKHYLNEPAEDNIAKNNSTFKIFLDKNKRLWFQSWIGVLGYLEIDSDQFTILEEQFPTNRFVYYITADYEQTVWVAHNQGISRFNEYDKTFELYDLDIKKSVYYILPDKENILWLGTEDGLVKFNTKNKQYERITEKSGLSNNLIYTVNKDKLNNLWISTGFGLNRYSLETSEFKHYFKNDGLQSNTFGLHTSFFDNEKNLLYTGGSDGFNVFYPSSITHNMNKPNTVIAELTINNQTANPQTYSHNITLEQAPTNSHQLTLKHDQNDFALLLSALDFNAPQNNQYAYYLEGFHKEWRVVKAKDRKISFAGLPHGQYKFHYKGSNNAGVWNEDHKTLNINILAPWWKSLPAYIVYFSISIFMVVYIVRVRTTHLRKRAQQLEQAITDSIKEITQQKNTIETLLATKDKMFANISHELRTPLTLILAPASALLCTIKDRSNRIQIDIIQKNAYRLLKLVNQFLELSRLQYQKNHPCTPKPVINIKILSETIAQSFNELANSKSICIQTIIKRDCWAFCSQDAYEKILINLLSNAIKYTPIQGRVTLAINSPNEHEVVIAISDTGKGILPEQQDLIFERFTRLESYKNNSIDGAGIGLSIVKELVEEANGKIELYSELNRGTTFKIRLPKYTGKPENPEQQDQFNNNIYQQKILEQLKIDAVSVSEKHSSVLSSKNLSHNDHYSLLIIEDNSDLCDFLLRNLSSSYHCIVALDGSSGLELAQQEIPDLILCDIMLPNLDGFQICQQLKENEKTCHIPIILLTALSDYEHRIKGLELQADDYLSKPFDLYELQLRLENLIVLKERIKRYFKIDDLEQPPQKEGSFIQYSNIANPRDIKLIQNLELTLEKNFADPEFNIDKMANCLFMNRRQLLRKTQAMLGISPANLLRSYRMLQAKNFLKQGKTIMETALETGHVRANHFSTVFKSYYGQTPRHYQNTLYTTEE